MIFGGPMKSEVGDSREIDTRESEETTSDRGTHYRLQAPEGLHTVTRLLFLYSHLRELGAPPL